VRLNAPEQELFILWLLKTEGEIGRYRLARMVNLSQGVTRGILARMKRKGMIMVRPRAGASSSKGGLRELAVLMRRHGLRLVKRYDEELLGLAPKSVIFQVAGRSDRLGQGIEQRDAAIKEGATGAVTFLFDGKMLNFPGVAEPLSKRSPMAFKQLRNQLRLKKGDVILIAFANTWWDAARGGFAAIRTLV